MERTSSTLSWYPLRNFSWFIFTINYQFILTREGEQADVFARQQNSAVLQLLSDTGRSSNFTLFRKTNDASPDLLWPGTKGQCVIHYRTTKIQPLNTAEWQNFCVRFTTP